MRDLKVAIVHDDFIQWGGAERLVLAMLEIFPEADLFATIASDQWLSELRKRGYQVKNQSVGRRTEIKITDQRSKILYLSWLQNFPLKDRLFRYYYSLYPLAVESFRFDGYDLVISSSARYAHGVLTKPETLHVAYVNSPARFLWDERLVPRNLPARKVVEWHRLWDRVASRRPDYVIANSKAPAERIRRFWQREADATIYPFAENPPNYRVPILATQRREYFLVISRLNQWKRVDVVTEAFREFGSELFIIGDGPERRKLEKISSRNVKFLGWVGEEGKFDHLFGCRALIVPQEEDFGIVILEANSCGKPVVAYKGGGALELVREGRNGVFFEEQSATSLLVALRRFDRLVFTKENCLEVAGFYTKERFKDGLSSFVEEKLAAFRHF